MEKNEGKHTERNHATEAAYVWVEFLNTPDQLVSRVDIYASIFIAETFIGSPAGSQRRPANRVICSGHWPHALRAACWDTNERGG